MRITHYPNLTEPQFFGCVAAFVDSLSGELNAATAALRRLTGRNKGGAFAFEMTLDTHRYGALIVIDRWSTVLSAFGPHLMLPRRRDILDRGAERVRAAEVEIDCRTVRPEGQRRPVEPDRLRARRRLLGQVGQFKVDPEVRRMALLRLAQQPHRGGPPFRRLKGSAQQRQIARRLGQPPEDKLAPRAP